MYSDKSVTACNGYSITPKFWWHLFFLEKIVGRMLLHLKDNSSKSFISINCLKYVIIILNYCASQTFNNGPHLVVMCVMDNTSALN